jgi:hypothetical protein
MTISRTNVLHHTCQDLRSSRLNIARLLAQTLFTPRDLLDSCGISNYTTVRYKELIEDKIHNQAKLSAGYIEVDCK